MAQFLFYPNSNSKKKVSLLLDILPVFFLVFAIYLKSSWTVIFSRAFYIVFLFSGFALAILSLLLKKIRFNSYDFLWIIVIAFYVLWRDESKYNITYAFITFYAYIVALLIRSKPLLFRYLLKLIIACSFVFVIATVIEALFPNFFFTYLIKVLTPQAQKECIDAYEYGAFQGIAYNLSPNAIYIACGLFSIVSLLLERRKKTSRFFFILLSILFYSTLLMTGKTGHNLFFLVALYIGYLIIRSKNFTSGLKNGMIFAFVIAFVIIIVFSVVPDSMILINRVILKINRGGIDSGRSEIYKTAFELIPSHLLVGMGIGGFSAWQGYYAGVHNDYLQILLETGLIGFFFFMSASICSIVLTISLVRKNLKNGNYSSFLSWSLFIQLFVLMYSMTGLARFDYEINLFYVIASIVPLRISSSLWDNKSQINFNVKQNPIKSVSH